MKIGKDIVELTFNLTWNCPVKCDYCYRAKSTDNSDKNYLSEEILVNQLKDSLNYNIAHYRFSGGEPTSLGDKLFYYSDLVYDITGKKPILMTSGILINDIWMKKAQDKFSSIAISIDNPLVSNKTNKLLSLIKNNYCNSLPFRYGLTLITGDFFNQIESLFDLMYSNANYSFMPQFDYPCLTNYTKPDLQQLIDLKKNTNRIFKKHGIIPYYFVYSMGSLLWVNQNIQRYVLNLHPEGNYQIYNSINERLSVEKKWRKYLLNQQSNSLLCNECEWLHVCKYHPLWELRYDWCELRKSIYEGIYSSIC